MSETMSFGEPDPDLNSGQILNWLEDSTPNSPLILDDLYCSMDDPWWGVDTIDANTISSYSSSPSADLDTADQSRQLASDLSRKGKAPDDHIPHVKKSSGNKKAAGKSTKDDSNIDNNKEGRWAEQLLNSCAVAITAGNMTRVQHLLYVLKELASPTGDANYRLAAHGVQALLHHLRCYQYPHKLAGGLEITPSFATSTPKFFKQSLINFNEINPWFTIPNNIANNTVLQVLSEQGHGSCMALHILDIGVSHGFQWPTLLEALSRRPGGPPPLVRLTVVPATPENHQLPFANCPPGYDFTSNIVRFAKDVNINLQINKLDNIPLQNLSAEAISLFPGETLIVCAQFRLHSLNHSEPDDRTEFLRLMRSMNPQGVILSDNMDCSCDNCSSFDSRFAKSLDYLWSFLYSTSAAFKGRDREERRLVEGEAAKALINLCEMNEWKEKWEERMNCVGFVEHRFAYDVVDQARELLKKYDSGWEMRVEEDGSVGLWWKGQPISFCSLWKTDLKKTYES